MESAGRFIKIEPELVREGRALGGPAVLVYMALAAHAFGDKSWCNPSLATIAEETGYDKATVCRALTKLESHGLIRRESTKGGRKQSSRYVLTCRERKLSRSCDSSERETVPRLNGNCRTIDNETVAGVRHEEDNEESGDAEQIARAAMWAYEREHSLPSEPPDWRTIDLIGGKTTRGRNGEPLGSSELDARGGSACRGDRSAGPPGPPERLDLREGVVLDCLIEELFDGADDRDDRNDDGLVLDVFEGEADEPDDEADQG